MAPTEAAAGSLGRDLTPTPIRVREQMGREGMAAATVGAASFRLPQGGGCEKQAWEPMAEAQPAVSTAPSQPASSALPGASPPIPLLGACLGGQEASGQSWGSGEPKTPLPAQLGLVLAERCRPTDEATPPSRHL